MKTAYILLTITLIISLDGCGEKKPNQVPLEQITTDNANDYRYIFKDKITSEKEKASRGKKDELGR